MNDLGLALQEQGLLPLFGLLLGAVVGSYLTVLTWRLPRRLQQAWSQEACAILGLQEPGTAASWHWRSRCPHCTGTLPVRDNLPILSWLLLRGRCRRCGCRIALRYPLIEVLTSLVSAWVLWSQGWSATAALLLLLSWCLIVLAVIDLEHFLLPDELTGPLLWAGLLLSLTPAQPLDAGQAILAAASGYLLLWSVNLGHRWLRGCDGMGAGDFKLLAALGAWAGLWALPPILLLASASALSFALLARLVRGRQALPYVAFGPHLALAGWTLLCLKPVITG